MLISITNLTQQRISIESLRTTISPLSTRTVKQLGLEKFDNQVESELKKFKSAGHISYEVTEDPNVDDDFEEAVLSMLNNFYHVDMIDAQDTTGDVVQVGFRLLNTGFSPAKVSRLVEIAVFDDALASVLAANAVLSSAIKGTIVAGEGTSALKVLTDENGEFLCELSDVVNEQVYVTCSSTPGGPAVNCTEIDAVAFI